MTRVRVMVLDQYEDLGGGQTVFLQVIDALQSGGLEVAAAFPHGGPLEQVIRKRFGDAVECLRIPDLRLDAATGTVGKVAAMAARSARLLGLLPALRSSDFVYVNGPRLFPVFLALSTLVRSRFVYHVHLDHSALELRLIDALLRHPRTHAVVANSPFVHGRLATRIGAGGHQRLKLVENALPRSLAGRPFVDRWQGTGRLQLVTVGRLMPEKGQDLVVDLAAANPGCDFHLLGGVDPEHRGYGAELRRRAGGNVVFHGAVEDVPATLDAIGAQVNLVPSRRDESFGLAAIEGMACSCLTVTSGRGGLLHIAEQTGAWTARRIEEWQAAVARICSAPRALSSSEARRQYERTMQRYDPGRFAREILGLLAQ